MAEGAEHPLFPRPATNSVSQSESPRQSGWVQSSRGNHCISSRQQPGPLQLWSAVEFQSLKEERVRSQSIDHLTVCVLFFCGVRIKARVLGILCKRSTTELHTSSPNPMFCPVDTIPTSSLAVSDKCSPADPRSGSWSPSGKVMSVPPANFCHMTSSYRSSSRFKVALFQDRLGTLSLRT